MLMSSKALEIHQRKLKTGFVTGQSNIVVHKTKFTLIYIYTNCWNRPTFEAHRLVTQLKQPELNYQRLHIMSKFIDMLVVLCIRISHRHSIMLLKWKSLLRLDTHHIDPSFMLLLCSRYNVIIREAARHISFPHQPVATEHRSNEGGGSVPAVHRESVCV